MLNVNSKTQNAKAVCYPFFYWLTSIRVSNMETIFHEKQEGSLCAQHCLNALLQGPYFTPVDLAVLAQQMDDEERLRMAESGLDSEDYRRFLEQPSGNYDDSGYFSVQVISSALRVWGLELVAYNSTEPEALQAQHHPADMQAFICNYRDHWFTIRRLGHQWFNLNSLLTGPELITDTYLAMFLAQLQQEGYSIFIVLGVFPECEADTLLRLVPAVQTVKPKAVTTVGHRLGSTTSKDSEEDLELQKALRLSLGQGNEDDSVFASTSTEVEDEDLQAALSMSLSNSVAKVDSSEDTELQKPLRLSLDPNTEETASQTEAEVDEEVELQKALRLSLQAENDQDDVELERAMKMSLECCEPNIVDSEEVRRRRLAYLEGRTLTNTISSTTQNKVNI